MLYEQSKEISKRISSYKALLVALNELIRRSSPPLSIEFYQCIDQMNVFVNLIACINETKHETMTIIVMIVF